MERALPRVALALLLALAACAPEAPPPAEPLPLPPPPPPHLRGGRVPPAPPLAADAPGHAGDAASVWRVRRDGTVGCADPAALRLLGERADAPPRILAEARLAGGCRTTFRVNEWVLTASEGDLVQLRLTGGPELTLWFRRVELAVPL